MQTEVEIRNLISSQLHRGKVEAGVDNLVARAGPVEARDDDRLCQAHVLVHRDRAGGRPEELTDVVPHLAGQLPPLLGPGAHPPVHPVL